MFRRWFVVAAFVASVPFSTTAAQSSTSVPELNRQAMAAYVELDFDRARALLDRALVVAARDGVRGTELARTHMNRGVLAIAANGDTESGLEHFLDALDADPAITPDPAMTTPEVAQVFRTARERVASQRATSTTSARGTAAVATPAETAASAPADADASAASSDEPASETDEPAPAPSKRASRLHFHSLGVGYHNAFVARADGGRYGFSGPTIAYDYFVGKRWGFMLHGEAWFPLYAHQSVGNGRIESHLLSDYPARHYGFDGLVMAARRFEFEGPWVLTTAVGAHAQAFVLRSVVYTPVELISLGIGGLLRVDWLANRHLSIHAQATTAFDPYDAIQHAQRIRVTIPAGGSVGCTFRF